MELVNDTDMQQDMSRSKVNNSSFRYQLTNNTSLMFSFKLDFLFQVIIEFMF